MTIKTFAFEAQQRIKQRAEIEVPRSHIYELLAVAFGFNTYAALVERTVFDHHSGQSNLATDAIGRISKRFIGMGYLEAPAIIAATELLSGISSHGLRTVDMDRLIDVLLFEQDGIRMRHTHPSTEYPQDTEYKDFDDNDHDSPVTNTDDYEDELPWHGISVFLNGNLIEAASRGNSRAHYALALALRPDSGSQGSEYWYGRQADGELLTGAQLEWANNYQTGIERERMRSHHLREAARLGHSDACVDAAEEFGDPAYLDAAHDVRDPVHASDVAAELGQPMLAAQWCAVAAEAGDIKSIRSMILHFDQADPQRRWMWLHFARLLGEDLTEDNYRLVHEDGSDYDDDVGGPGFPVGEDGIKLQPLDDMQNEIALRKATTMLDRMDR